MRHILADWWMNFDLFWRKLKYERELGDPSTNKHQIHEKISFTKLKHTKTSLSRSSHGWLATLMLANNGLLMERVM